MDADFNNQFTGRSTGLVSIFDIQLYDNLTDAHDQEDADYPRQPYSGAGPEDRMSTSEPVRPQTGKKEVDASQFDIVKAVQYGAVDRVIELIESGQDPNHRDEENVTLLHWAAINNRKEVVQYLLSKGADMNAIGGDLQSTPLHWATRQGHLSMVVQLMKSGADASIFDGEGCNCLHLAAQFGHTAIVAFLIAKGEEINSTDVNGMTALMWSAYRISTNDPTRLLITLGASLNLTDSKHKNSALHWAVYSRNSNAVSLLLKAGADTNIRNGAGDTPYEMAQKLQISWLLPRLAQDVQDKQIKKSKNILFRLKNDKEVRYWLMMSAPFFVYAVLGFTFDSDMTYLSKAITLLLLLLAVMLSSRFVFDDRFHHILPISIYLATKFWMYVTFFIYLMPGQYLLSFLQLSILTIICLSSDSSAPHSLFHHTVRCLVLRLLQVLEK